MAELDGLMNQIISSRLRQDKSKSLAEVPIAESSLGEGPRLVSEQAQASERAQSMPKGNVYLAGALFSRKIIHSKRRFGSCITKCLGRHC